jgi:hypothetical protein
MRLPKKANWRWLGAVGVAACLALPAQAVIKRLYPLADIIADADSIRLARVIVRDRQSHQVTLKPASTLKGDPESVRFSLALSGSDHGSELPILEERLPPGRTVLFFGKRGRFALGYTNGTWFRLAEPERAGRPWRFAHLEPYLTRTFRGSTEALRRTVTDVLAGKRKAPDPDPTVSPGYGPR